MIDGFQGFRGEALTNPPLAGVCWLVVLILRVYLSVNRYETPN